MRENLARKRRDRVDDDRPSAPVWGEDPIAIKTEWTPLKGGGTNFRTHRLVRSDMRRMEFKATKGALAFYLAFFVAGLIVVALTAPSMLWFDFFSLDLSNLFPAIFGLIFMTTGGLLFYFGSAPVVFDHRNGYFWKGHSVPDERLGNQHIKHCVELNQVHALQLVREHVSSSDSSYNSYELNLILKDGTRLNVVDHGNREKLAADAATLADFLNCPVWDAC